MRQLSSSMKKQRGGTFLGLVIGLVLGMAVSLLVAIFITKVPIPFLGKDASKAPISEAAEAKRNQEWNPNQALLSKSAAKAASAAVAASQRPAAAAPGPAIPAAASPPVVDLASAKPTVTAVDPFLYFVQVGAFRNAEDADAQRARLSLGGIESKVSEREQSGRMVFRVRVGPFDFKEDADKVKERLITSGMEAVLVRVQR